MSGYRTRVHPRTPGSPLRRRRWAAACATVALALVALVAAPGVATAAPTLTPVLNCIQAGSGTSYTAVLGYSNPTRTTYYLYGSPNRISPSSYDGDQPHKFSPGTYNGVFSLPISSGTVTWTLQGTTLTISKNAAKACPKDTQMPADGNGTGVVVVLAAAAAVGVLVVHRARRRSAAGAPEQEAVDA